MLLDLRGELSEVELRFGFSRERGAIVQIVEQVLVGIGTGGSVHGKSLKDAHVPLRSFGLVKVAFDHRQLVVPGARIVADFNVLSKKLCRLGELLLCDAEIGELQKRLGKVRK